MLKQVQMERNAKRKKYIYFSFIEPNAETVGVRNTFTDTNTNDRKLNQYQINPKNVSFLTKLYFIKQLYTNLV